MVNDAEGQEKQRDFIPQKAHILSFHGSTTLLGLQQLSSLFMGPFRDNETNNLMESNMVKNPNW